MFQISLRQLLLLVAAVALAIMSLKYASPMWQAVMGLATLVTFLAIGIVGIFDRGPRQAFGIALALVMLLYGLLLAPWLGLQQQLPTSQLLLALHSQVQEQDWVNLHTGEIIAPWQTNAIVWNSNTGAYNLNGVTAELRLRPPIDAFVAVGHCWWALLLGYLGGQFARFVYLRRAKNEPTPRTE